MTPVLVGRVLACLVVGIPVHADGHEVEYGRGGADNVHGDVGVAHELGKAPHAPVHLKKREEKESLTYLFFLKKVIPCFHIPPQKKIILGVMFLFNFFFE